jgi:hypothetical protein
MFFDWKVISVENKYLCMFFFSYLLKFRYNFKINKQFQLKLEK